MTRDLGAEKAAGIPTPGDVGADTVAAEAGDRPDLTSPGSPEAVAKAEELKAEEEKAKEAKPGAAGAEAPPEVKK